MFNIIERSFQDKKAVPHISSKEEKWACLYDYLHSAFL